MTQTKSFIPHPDELVALLDGRQTMLRRPIDPPPPDEIYRDGSGLWHPVGPWAGRDWRCPFGQPGDRLWIQEDYYADRYSANAKVIHSNPGVAYYRAESDLVLQNWYPADTMPRWASRLTLDVLEVRVEQLQDITAKECVLEGCLPNNWSPNSWFADRWDARYADAFPWASNPHVWTAKVRRQGD